MPITRRKTAVQQNTMAEIRTELGEEHAALAAVSEEVMAKYFKEADERAEARAKRLEKQIDKMNNVLSRHTEEIKTIRLDTAKLQQRVSNAEKTTADCQTDLHALNNKLIDLEDRSRRENLLLFNLKEGLEKDSALAFLMEKIPTRFIHLAASPPELMRCHRLGRPPGPRSDGRQPGP